MLQRGRNIMMAALGAVFAATPAQADEAPASGYDLAAGHQATWTHADFNKGYENNCSSSGIPLGNGDFKVIIGQQANAIDMTLLKNDFWRLAQGKENCQPRYAGKLAVVAPRFDPATFTARQQFKDGRTTIELKSGRQRLRVEAVLFATTNLLMLRFSADGGDCDLALELAAGGKPPVETAEGARDGMIWVSKGYSRDVDIPTATAIGMKIDSADGKPSFTVKAGETVRAWLSIASLAGTGDPAGVLPAALGLLASADAGELEQQHRAWWSNYWEKSWVRIPSLPGIETHYYQSLYGMGAASRDPEYPPGIFGWETVDTPGWNGDYHMNYNHFAPFYGLYSANRIEQADPQDAPLLDFMPRARDYARVSHDKNGLLFPVGIGPKGMDSTLLLRKGQKYYDNPKHSDPYKDGQRLLIFGQKSNSAYAAVNIIQRWRTTRDLVYAREKGYPFVKGVADYWEDYLVFEPSGKGGPEDGRYVIYRDSIHEGSGENTNPILGLGLVPNVFKAALEMSSALEVDAGRRGKWQHIIDHMSGWSYQEMEGRTVFRYSESGTAWWRNNTLAIQHIYPANAITLDSDPELLQVARNTAIVRDAWKDNNGTNSFYPACVRIGLDPDRILQGLQQYVKHIKPNGFRSNNPHGIENYSTTPNTINMMMCMSVDYVLRIFPVWPKDRDAKFHDIRAWGAFLVSGEQKDGVLQPVTIRSEKGSDCTMVNPWPGKPVQLTRNGKPSETLEGERFTFKTAPHETIVVRPE